MKRLPRTQETALLRKHLTGDCGPHKWTTVRALLRAGYLAEQANRIVVTPRGKQYCDAYHLEIAL